MPPALPSVHHSCLSRESSEEHSCALFQSLPFATNFRGRTDIRENFTEYSTSVFVGEEKREGEMLSSVDHSGCMESTVSISPIPLRQLTVPLSSFPPALSSSSSLSSDELHTATHYYSNSFRGRYLLGVKVQLPQGYFMSLFTCVQEEKEDQKEEREALEALSLNRIKKSEGPNTERSPLSLFSLPSATRRKRLRLETVSSGSMPPSPVVRHRPDISTSGGNIGHRDGAPLRDSEKENVILSGGNGGRPTLSEWMPLVSSSVIIWGHDRLPESNSKTVQWIQLAKEIHATG